MENSKVRFSPFPFAIISLLIIFLLYQVSGLIILNIIGNSANQLRIGTIIGQFIFLLLPILVLSKIQFGKISAIAKFKIPLISEIFLITVSVISLTILLEGFLSLQSQIPWPEEIKQIIQRIELLFNDAFKVLLSTNNIFESILVFITIALTPAICEELVFRGFLQSSLNLNFSPKLAFILTGILFGLFHFNPLNAIPLVIIGIYFSYLVYLTDSIVASMIAHLTNNTVMMLIYFSFPEFAEPMEQNYSSSEILSIISMMIFSSLIFYFTIKLLKFLQSRKNEL